VPYDRSYMTMEDKLPAIFTYHDDPAKIPDYIAIRDAALKFAKVIVAHTPTCSDQTAAIRLLREAVMTANAAIALDGLV
jgi:hypothetical protein